MLHQLTQQGRRVVTRRSLGLFDVDDDVLEPDLGEDVGTLPLDPSQGAARVAQRLVEQVERVGEGLRPLTGLDLVPGAAGEPGDACRLSLGQTQLFPPILDDPAQGVRRRCLHTRPHYATPGTNRQHHPP